MLNCLDGEKSLGHDRLVSSLFQRLLGNRFSRFNVMDHLDNSVAFFKNFEVPDQQYFNSSHSIYVNVRNFYFEHFLKPTLLRDLDSFSMYNGVEVRVPFLQDNIIAQA